MLQQEVLLFLCLLLSAELTQYGFFWVAMFVLASHDGRIVVNLCVNQPLVGQILIYLV